MIVVQSLSRVQLFVTPWMAAYQASLFFTISQSMLKLMSIELVMPFNHLILWHPLLFLPSIFPSTKVFSNDELYASGGQSIGASALVLPMNIRIDFLKDWLVWSPWSPRDSQKSSTPQFKSISSSGFSLLYGPTLTSIHIWLYTTELWLWTFVGKVMSQLFNMKSRFVIAFLPSSKCLLILWLKSPSTVILEPHKIKSVTVSIVSPSICHEVMGPDTTIYFSECWVLSQLFHSPLSLSSRGSLVPLCFLP